MIERLRSMDAEELRFRLACETRKAADRARTRLASPRWRRSDLAALLRPSAARDGADLETARRASRRGQWMKAHHALAAHFTGRAGPFPLDPRSLATLASRIRLRFSDAMSNACARADRMLDGRYDVLGYRDLPFGTPPAWHTDPVHRREAPRTFWAALPYLDPRYGDHKIIWEINRHQHWLALARAYHLSGDGRYYDEVVRQLASWMDANPPLQGVNWASMLELGFRSLSWLWTLHFFAPSAMSDPAGAAPWIVDLLHGLDRQLTHIERNLSLYFSPNTHLTGEALALYVAGRTLPELRGSDHRAAVGRDVLVREIDRQIHADGGHAELSAHYHRYTTDFYLLALVVARDSGDPAAAIFEAAARRLAAYLRTLADDQGRLPLLGDDDGGQLFPICGRAPFDCRDTLAAAAAILGDPTLAVSDTPEEVFWLRGALPLEAQVHRPTIAASAALPDTGYYVSRTPQGDHMVFDAGRHGFLNGGHAHADALSVALTVRGLPLLVDAGTGTYTMDAGMRDRLRSTAMHNTVVVNGQPQSETRGPFHWGATANASASLWRSNRLYDYAEGRHDGYEPIGHARGVLAIHGFGWLVLDHLLGRADASAEWFWHVHPDWEVNAAGDGVLLQCRGSRVVLASSAPAVRVEDGLDTFAPVYGRFERGTCLRATTAGPLPRTVLTVWLPAGENDRRVAIAPLALTAPPPAGWHGAAFRISVADRELLVLSAVEHEAGTTAAEGPGRIWGCAEAQTDGRLAVIDPAESADSTILIGGRQLAAISSLASSVHSATPAERAGNRK